MSTIYLCRHATPDWTRKDLLYHLPPGPPLTTQGIEEAWMLGAFLHKMRTCQIYTSPLERCQHTAQIAGEVSAAQVDISPSLTEQAPGEEQSAIHTRLWPIFEVAHQLSVERKRPVVLLTHGGPIGVLLRALGMPEETLNQQRTFDHHNPLPPAGAWEVSRNGDHLPWELNLVFRPKQVLDDE
jgi:broad specificity phosphatase PhoE